MSGRNTSVALSDHFAAFIETQVKAGRYASASEVVRAGLRLLEENERRVQALLDAIREGEESGVAEEFDPDEFLAQMHREHAAKG